MLIPDMEQIRDAYARCTRIHANIDFRSFSLGHMYGKDDGEQMMWDHIEDQAAKDSIADQH